MSAVVILKPDRGPRSIVFRMQDDAARDRCMDSVGRLVANAGSYGQRVEMGKRIIRYGSMVLCHTFGLRQTASYLQSVVGQIIAESEARI